MEGVSRLGILAIALAAALPPAARAQGCPVPAGASARLEVATAESRLAFLRSRLGAEAGRVRTWQLWWSVGYGGLAVGQLAAVPFAEGAGPKADWAVGAASAATGMGLVLLFPPDVGSNEARLASLPPDGCPSLAEAERLFEGAAASEAAQTGWLVHAGNLLLNAGFGLVLGLGWQRWESAAWTFALGTALGEATILTQPTRLGHDLERYRAGDLASGEPARARLVPVPTRGGLVLALAASF